MALEPKPSVVVSLSDMVQAAADGVLRALEARQVAGAARANINPESMVKAGFGVHIVTTVGFVGPRPPFVPQETALREAE